MFIVAAALAALAAATGWFVDGFYTEGKATLEARARYGGLVILVVMVPLALVAYVLEQRDHPLPDPVMLGLVAHLGFMHGVLAFNYRENELFVLYSAIVGLCLLLGVTGLTDFARSVDPPRQTPAIRLASAGLVLAAVIGYGYWISEVTTALTDDTIAQGLTGTDLPANAARVIDMAIMLPLAAFGGANLWRGRGHGLAISAVMSTFLIFIGFTVIAMEIGVVNTTDRDLVVAMIAGFGFTIGLSLMAAAITYRALALSAARR
jgi:hypothetical protein